MTLAELAVSYRAQVRALQSRIRLVEELSEDSTDNCAEKERRLLNAMLRDMRDMAVWCERYYDKSFRHSDHYRI